MAKINIKNANKDNELVKQYLDTVLGNSQPNNFDIEENGIYITSEDFKQLVAVGLRIDEAKICIEKPLSFLDEIVPEALVDLVPEKYQDYAKTINGDNTVIYKSYKDCCRYYANDTSCLVEFGFVDANKNRDRLPVFDELMAWVQCFPDDTLWGGKALQEKIDSEYGLNSI